MKDPHKINEEELGPRKISEILDRIEEELRERLIYLEMTFKSTTKAKSALLAYAVNERDRTIFEMLIKQRPSTKGSRSGNRKSIVTYLQDKEIIEFHREWQAKRNTPGGDREFAMWWHDFDQRYRSIGIKPRPPIGPVTEPDIKRITKKLRDARRRVKHHDAEWNINRRY